jgi:hypothetical protein
MPNQPFVHLGDGHYNSFEDFTINVSNSTRPALGIGNQNQSTFRRFNITEGDSFKTALSARRPDLTRSQVDDIFEILRRYPDEPVKRESSLAAIGSKIMNGASLAFPPRRGCRQNHITAFMENRRSNVITLKTSGAIARICYDRRQNQGANAQSANPFSPLCHTGRIAWGCGAHRGRFPHYPTSAPKISKSRLSPRISGR